MHTSKVTVLNTITETFNTNTVSTVNVEHIHQTKNSMDTSNKEQHGYIKQRTACNRTYTDMHLDTYLDLN